MQPLRIHNILRLGNRRRALRNNSTAAEIYLWPFLKSKQVQGRRFRRQHSIANYIVDFYCASEKLILELDGAVHDHPDQIIYDRKRDKYLKELGFKILRIKNDLVFCNMPEVLQLIKSQFDIDKGKKTPQSREKRDSSPLPTAGRLKKGEHETYTPLCPNIARHRHSLPHQLADVYVS